MRFCLILLIAGWAPCAVWGEVQSSSSTVQRSTAAVQESTATPTEVPEPEQEQTTSSQESESKGIIPYDAETSVSTQPITPVSVFTQKKPYDQAQEELVRALKLFNNGHPEAASDIALEAYEDFMELRRVPGIKRATIKAQMRQAASVYVEAGVIYVNNYVRRGGGVPAIVEEGKSRLEDLRDVARNYPDLNKMLNKAIVELSSGTVGPPK